MVQWVKIGGKERPIAFGWAVAYDYEFQTGGNYIGAVMSLIDEINAIAAVSGSDDPADAARIVSVRKITDLVFACLTHAHKEQRIEFPYTVYDVAEWLFTDHEVRGQCILAIMESMPKANADGESAPAAKKKTVARPGSTGRGLSKRLQR